MIRGVIFDLDGTTLNTLDDIVDSFNATLEEAGIEPRSRDVMRLGVGRGFRILVDRVLPEVTDDKEREKLALRYHENYSKRYADRTRPYEGMPELLRKLQDDGIKLAVDSNKSDFFVKDLIRRNYPDIEFGDVMGSLPDYALKPDPGRALKIIDNMGLQKEEVIYVGDSDTDMQTAVNAGIVPVVTPLGTGRDGHLYNVNADVAAAALAKELKVRKFALVSDVAGLMKDPNDPGTLFSTLHVSDIARLREDGTISGGMIPKMDSCVGAIRAGVRKVHLVDGRMAHSLLLEIFTREGVGTEITE